ncbi:MAG: terminase small subunit [Planctomycetes bacterium]|nr:terminase small subunit [Planctomycetota bacterium]
MSKEDLKDSHKKFAEEYILDWNATRAYQVAYPDCGYDTAKSNGYKLLTNTYIKEYIEEIQKDIAKLAGISRLSIVKDLINIKDHAEQEKDQIKAIEVVNKMLGMNEPEKTEITEHKITIVEPEFN